MFLISIIATFFTLYRLFCSVHNYCSKPVLKAVHTKYDQNKNVSVLIPARNEAHNIGKLLHSLKNSSSNIFEIIVFDDASNDETAQIVLEAMAEMPNLRLIKGGLLPKGWLGKNHACYQLALNAKGTYLFFIDADVWLNANAINSLLAEMEKNKLGLLSLFPSQSMNQETKYIVPIMLHILLSLLPLHWIKRFGFPSMSAANGQIMCFSASTYSAINGHEAVKDCIVEDIALMKNVKRYKAKGATLLGGELVYCNMYNTKNEAILGFSKNIIAGFNGLIGLWIWLIILGPFYLVLLFDYQYFKLAFLLVFLNVVSIFLINELAFKKQFNYIWHLYYKYVISIKATLLRLQKKTMWKGRLLS